MLGSKKAKDIDAFFTRRCHQNLDIYITTLNHGMNYIKTLFKIFVVILYCFNKQ